MVINKIDRRAAVYAEGSSFMCAQCMYYRSGKCLVVKGAIKPKGCCNLFKNKSMRYK